MTTDSIESNPIDFNAIPADESVSRCFKLHHPRNPNQMNDGSLQRNFNSNMNPSIAMRPSKRVISQSIHQKCPEVVFDETIDWKEWAKKIRFDSLAVVMVDDEDE